MTLDMLVLLAIVAVASVLLAAEVFPVDKVSVLVLASLIVAGLITPEQAVSGFGNQATITVACMLVLSFGVERSGGLNLLANRMVDLARGSELHVLVAVLLAVGVLSAFINNTAAVALFLPLTMAVSREQRVSPSKLLMPMSFAAMFAGMCTLIGTSTNLLVYALVQEAIGWQIGMFEFAHVGILFVIAGMIYLVFFGRHLLPSRRIQADLTGDYRLRHFVTEMVLQSDSELVGKTLLESRLGEHSDVEVIEIIRGQERHLPSAEQRLEAGDILLVRGDPGTLVRLQDDQGVLIKALSLSDRDLEDDSISLVEAFISPNSSLIEKTIKEVNFRRKFQAIALAIRSHEGRTVREKIAKVKLEFGDSLLILTSKSDLHILRQSPDFLVLEEVRFSSIRKKDFYLAVGIFLAIVVIATSGLLSIMEAALVGVGLMLITGCVRLNELYTKISWQTIVMLGCLIPLGAAMENTRLAMTIAHGLVDMLQVLGPVAVLSGLYFLTFLLTSVMSNNATAVLMVPIALSIATELQISPRPFIIAVMFAASASFMTPIGYQTNTFIFGPGGYKFHDFLKVGAPLTVFFWILATFLLPIFWPF